VLRFTLPRTEISTTKSSSDMCLLWLKTILECPEQFLLGDHLLELFQ
jgi:hypothetical protein